MSWYSKALWIHFKISFDFYPSTKLARQAEEQAIQWRIQDFPEGAPTSNGAPTYYLTNFSENCIIEEILCRGKTRSTVPTPRSATLIIVSSWVYFEASNAFKVMRSPLTFSTPHYCRLELCTKVGYDTAYIHLLQDMIKKCDKNNDSVLSFDEIAEGVKTSPYLHKYV